MTIKDEDRTITVEIKIDNNFKILSGKVKRGDNRDLKS